MSGGGDREFFIDNLLIRIPGIIAMMRGPASRHGSLNSPFQVALEREFFIDNLMVRIHLIIVMILVDRPCAMGV